MNSLQRSLAVTIAVGVMVVMTVHQAVGDGNSPANTVPAKYVINNEDCNRIGGQGGQSCSACSTTILFPGGCPGSAECVAIKCTGGAMMFDACTAGSGSAGLCQSGTPVSMAPCTGCSTYSATPPSCVDPKKSTCTAPNSACTVGGVATAAPTITLC